MDLERSPSKYGILNELHVKPNPSEPPPAPALHLNNEQEQDESVIEGATCNIPPVGDKGIWIIS